MIQRSGWALVLIALAAACTTEALEPIGAATDGGLEIAAPICTEHPTGRIDATLTYLPSNGRVLLVGGYTLADRVIQYRREIEIYDPRTGTWSNVGELHADQPRSRHTATLFDDGRVLIAGGEALVQTHIEALKSAFIIDARDPNNVIVDSAELEMNEARTGHVAVNVFAKGVVITGGRQLNPASTAPRDQTYLASIELFDPKTNTFTLAGEMTVARYGHTIEGDLFQWIIAGGANAEGPQPSVEVMTAGRLSTRPANGTLNAGPVFTRSAKLSDELIAFSGGYPTLEDAERSSPNPQRPSSTFEVWDWRQGRERLVCSTDLQDERGMHTMTALEVGSVLIAGGFDAEGRARTDALVLRSTLGCSPGHMEHFELCDARGEHEAVRLGNSGHALIAGGRHETANDSVGASSTKSEVH